MNETQDRLRDYFFTALSTLIGALLGPWARRASFVLIVFPQRGHLVVEAQDAWNRCEQ
jgi:hypothetical protein